MNNYTRTAQEIIKAQEKIIGPIAMEQAKKVNGLLVSSNNSINITGDAKDVLSKLVEKYEELFGRASIEVCRDAVKELKPPVPVDQLPKVLQ